MVRPNLVDRYANDANALGPPSGTVSLPAFSSEVSQHAGAFEGADPALEQLTAEDRNELAGRFDVSDLRAITESALADPATAKNFDIWQKARYLCGTEDPESMAQAQAILLMTARHKFATDKALKKEEEAVDEEVPRDEEMANETIDPVLQEQIEKAVGHFPIQDPKAARTVFARTPMPTAEQRHKPPEHLLPAGLRMYRPFPEARYYMRQSRASDMNTITETREHERALPYKRARKPKTGPYSDQLPPSTDGPDMLITCTFHPVRTHNAVLRNAGAPTRQQRIILPGSHTLVDLRAALQCPSDAIPDTGVHDHPTVPLSDDHRQLPTFIPKRRPAGGVFAIDGVLFPDTRPVPDGQDPRIDYAEALLSGSIRVIDWPVHAKGSSAPVLVIEGVEPTTPRTKRPPPTLPDYRAGEPMELVRLNGLDIKLGEPYWFLHQGNCEHVFTFDEIRAVHSTDPQPMAGPTCPYPITTLLSRLEQTKCRICNRDPATRCLVDDDLAGDSPTLLCDICFYYLHGLGGQLGTGAAKVDQLNTAERNARLNGVSIVPLLEDLSEFV